MFPNANFWKLFFVSSNTGQLEPKKNKTICLFWHLDLILQWCHLAANPIAVSLKPSLDNQDLVCRCFFCFSKLKVFINPVQDVHFWLGSLLISKIETCRFHFTVCDTERFWNVSLAFSLLWRLSKKCKWDF